MALRTAPTAARRAPVPEEPQGTAATLGCPKRMAHGPCGGVRADGGCETGDRPCSFVAATPTGQDVGEPPAAPLSAPALDLVATMDRRPVVLAEVPSSGPDPDEFRRVAATLAGAVDAALLGDAPWARAQLPPSLRAAMVAAEGVRPWASLNCRDRNRVALEGELAGLAAVGVGAVHCVTGDHPVLGDRTDAPGVFDLDSVGLTRLAAGSGLLVSVAESPSAPPVVLRPARAALKASAGARVVIVNHAGCRSELEAFVAATRVLAPRLRVVVSVPLVCSASGAERLRAFLPSAGAVATGRPAPIGAPRRARADARSPSVPDPPTPVPGVADRASVATAVRRAVADGEWALGVPGVAGVDLSGVAGPGEEVLVASALASVGRALGAGA